MRRRITQIDYFPSKQSVRYDIDLGATVSAIETTFT
jgi:hypothetical protein